MVTSYCGHLLQSLFPPPNVLLRFTLTSFSEHLPKITVQLLYIRWIYFVENGHHSLTQLLPAVHNLHQLLKTPLRRSIVLREQDDRDLRSSNPPYEFRSDGLSSLDPIIVEKCDCLSFKLLFNVTKKVFADIFPTEARNDIV